MKNGDVGGGGGAFIFSDEKRFISIVNINRQVQQLGTCDDFFIILTINAQIPGR